MRKIVDAIADFRNASMLLSRTRATFALSSDPGSMSTPARTALIALIAVLVIARHHTNIARLPRGEESEITLSKS
jgi:glycerol-3-phosphate acyltransferase PlsY